MPGNSSAASGIDNKLLEEKELRLNMNILETGNSRSTWRNIWNVRFLIFLGLAILHCFVAAASAYQISILNNRKLSQWIKEGLTEGGFIKAINSHKLRLRNSLTIVFLYSLIIYFIPKISRMLYSIKLNLFSINSRDSRNYSANTTNLSNITTNSPEIYSANTTNLSNITTNFNHSTNNISPLSNLTGFFRSKRILLASQLNFNSLGELLAFFYISLSSLPTLLILLLFFLFLSPITILFCLSLLFITFKLFNSNFPNFIYFSKIFIPIIISIALLFEVPIQNIEIKYSTDRTIKTGNNLTVKTGNSFRIGNRIDNSLISNNLVNRLDDTNKTKNIKDGYKIDTTDSTSNKLIDNIDHISRAKIIKLAGKFNMNPNRIFITHSKDLNAFAVSDLFKSTIFVTSGLMDKFDIKVILGILVHEMGHVYNQDSLKRGIGVILFGLIILYIQQQILSRVDKEDSIIDCDRLRDSMRDREDNIRNRADTRVDRADNIRNRLDIRNREDKVDDNRLDIRDNPIDGLEHNRLDDKVDSIRADEVDNIRTTGVGKKENLLMKRILGDIALLGLVYFLFMISMLYSQFCESRADNLMISELGADALPFFEYMKNIHPEGYEYISVLKVHFSHPSIKERINKMQ